MACALDTLCGQAHTGSSDQKASGKHLQRSIIIMFFISLIVAIVWLVAEPLLILLKQDPEIARLTSLYLFYLIPAIFPYFIYECLRRFLQSQGIMNGSMFVVVSVFPINIMLQYFFIYYLDFGYIGAAIGLSVTNILEPLLLLVYMKIHPNGFEAWGGWSIKECFNVRLLWEFCKLGIPGTLI